MKVFNDDMPIYLQLRKHIEEQILARAIKEEDKLKSFRELAAEYSINPITVGNAINALVEEGILSNKRGIGVFVASGAREKIISSRRSSFVSDSLEPSLRLAKSYEIPKREILRTINDIYGEEK
jgi:DNA-binding transcriptional regulator YhcF (GntR family)